MKLTCEKCGFNFETQAEENKKKCPYCGEKKAIQMAKSAEDLIREL